MFFYINKKIFENIVKISALIKHTFYLSCKLCQQQTGYKMKNIEIITKRNAINETRHFILDELHVDQKAICVHVGRRRNWKSME